MRCRPSLAITAPASRASSGRSPGMKALVARFTMRLLVAKRFRASLLAAARRSLRPRGIAAVGSKGETAERVKDGDPPPPAADSLPPRARQDQRAIDVYRPLPRRP